MRINGAKNTNKTCKRLLVGICVLLYAFLLYATALFSLIAYQIDTSEIKQHNIY